MSRNIMPLFKNEEEEIFAEYEDLTRRRKPGDEKRDSKSIRAYLELKEKSFDLIQDAYEPAMLARTLPGELVELNYFYVTCEAALKAKRGALRIAVSEKKRMLERLNLGLEEIVKWGDKYDYLTYNPIPKEYAHLAPARYKFTKKNFIKLRKEPANSGFNALLILEKLCENMLSLGYIGNTKTLKFGRI